MKTIQKEHFQPILLEHDFKGILKVGTLDFKLTTYLCVMKTQRI